MSLRHSLIIRGLPLLGICVCGIASVRSGHQKIWPEIKPLNDTYAFSDVQADVDTPVAVVLTDVDGVARYRIECHSGDYEGEFVIYFSGLFQCVAAAVDGDRVTSWNLLAEDTNTQRRTDWWNRGRFLAKHLRPPCSEYQEYGPVRTFRFRGMVLTLAIRDIRWMGTARDGTPRVAGFKFDLKAHPAPTVTSMVAAPPDTPAAPRECFP